MATLLGTPVQSDAIQQLFSPEVYFSISDIYGSWWRCGAGMGYFLYIFLFTYTSQYVGFILVNILK